MELQIADFRFQIQITHTHSQLRALIQVTATLEGNQCPDVGSLKSNLKF